MTGGGPSSTSPLTPKKSSPPFSSSATPSPLTSLRSTIFHPQQQVTLTCYIPPSKIGAVIGRGGKTIINLQREASRRSNHPNPIRMSVASNNSNAAATNTNSNKDNATTSTNNSGGSSSNNNVNNNNSKDNSNSSTNNSSGTTTTTPEGPSELWTPVIIRGDPVGCFAASQLLMPLIEDEMDDVVLEVPIQRNKHSAVIGRKGGTIAVLSADHNVRIMVPSSRSGSVDQPLFPAETKENLNMIQLEGDVGDVEKCLLKLLQVVTGEVVIGGGKDNDGGNGNSRGNSGGSNNVEKIVSPPSGSEDLVPSLAKLRQIGKKTNTIVRRKRVERGEEETETQFIISGKTDCVDTAIVMFGKLFIVEDLDNNNTKDEQKRGGNLTNSPAQNREGGRGKGKGVRSGRGSSGRGSSTKSFSQRGRGRGSSSSNPSTTS